MSQSVQSEIARKNDECRRTLDPRLVRVVMTQGVAYSQNQAEIIEAVQSFDKFNKDNDPYGEHDFGSVAFHGTTYFFKFDYYDDDYRCYKEDGNRILTIMRADEY
jgi:hypothetical protein